MQQWKIDAIQEFFLCPKSGKPLAYDPAIDAFVAGPNRYPVRGDVVHFLDQDEILEKQDLRSEIFEYWSKYTPIQFEFKQGISDSELVDNLRHHEEVTDSLYPYQKEVFRYDRVAGKSFLEIGVGQGEQFCRYVKSSPSLAIGIDFSQKALEITGRRLRLQGLDALLVRGDASRLPLKNGTLDFVMSCGVIHHIPKIENACKEIGRVLKPATGECLIMVYSKNSIWYWWDISVVNFLKSLLINKLPEGFLRRLMKTDPDKHPFNFPDKKVSLLRVANASTELGGWRNPLSMFLTPARIRALFGKDFSYRFFSKETGPQNTWRVRAANCLNVGCFLYAEIGKQ